MNNAKINGERGKHVSRFEKAKTSKKRRVLGKKEVKDNG